MAQVKSLRTGIKFKNTPIGKIPVDWEVGPIADVCEVIGGSTPSTAIKDYWNGNILWATPTDVTNLNGRTIEDTRQKITEKGLESSAANLLQEGSILMTSRATIGACAINTKPMATNQGFASLVCKDSVYNWFVFYLISFFRKELERLGSGSTFKEVSKKSIKSFQIPLPPLHEQKRIAEILSTVDNAIEETDNIIEKTKELKKGLLQKLLTRGIGHKKFKKTEIGSMPTEWELRKLRDIVADFYNGGTPDTKEKGYWDGKIPWITGADFVDQKVSKIRRYITVEGVKSSATNVIPKDNLLIVTRTGVGKLALAPFDIAISQDITGVITDAKKMRPDFLYWFLYSNEKRLKSLIQGTSINGVLREDLAALSVCMPSLAEQKNISEMLFSIDHQIDTETDYKLQLQSLKKSLMQVLLTGKVRVQLRQ